MPASLTPIESTTAMHPSGMASMAARVEIGEAQLAGVARSSRAGTKRSVNASPTSRGWPSRIGRVPRSQTLRSPFFSRTVVNVAVETAERVSITDCSRGIGWFLELAAGVIVVLTNWPGEKYWRDGCQGVER